MFLLKKDTWKDKNRYKKSEAKIIIGKAKNFNEEDKGSINPIEFKEKINNKLI